MVFFSLSLWMMAITNQDHGMLKTIRFIRKFTDGWFVSISPLLFLFQVFCLDIIIGLTRGIYLHSIWESANHLTATQTSLFTCLNTIESIAIENKNRIDRSIGWFQSISADTFLIILQVFVLYFFADHDDTIESPIQSNWNLKFYSFIEWRNQIKMMKENNFFAKRNNSMGKNSSITNWLIQFSAIASFSHTFLSSTSKAI